MEAHYPNYVLYGLLILGSWLSSSLLQFQVFHLSLSLAAPGRRGAALMVLPATHDARFLPPPAVLEVEAAAYDDRRRSSSLPSPSSSSSPPPPSPSLPSPSSSSSPPPFPSLPSPSSSSSLPPSPSLSSPSSLSSSPPPSPSLPSPSSSSSSPPPSPSLSSSPQSSSSQRPSSLSSSSCEGRYVYTVDIPERFNMLKDCVEGSPLFDDIWSWCAITVNGGMGPRITGDNGTDIGIIPSTGGWYSTDLARGAT